MLEVVVQSFHPLLVVDEELWDVVTELEAELVLLVFTELLLVVGWTLELEVVVLTELVVQSFQPWLLDGEPVPVGLYDVVVEL